MTSEQWSIAAELVDKFAHAAKIALGDGTPPEHVQALIGSRIALKLDPRLIADAIGYCAVRIAEVELT